MLLEATDAHFAWLLGQAQSPAFGLCLPPGGVDQRETLELLRAMTRRLNAAGSRGSWLVVVDNEVVGLCGYKLPPTADGVVEIGYGIAPCRRNLGHATRAVRAMMELARLDLAVSHVVASTAVANAASQTVLKRNGFAQSGASHDPDDGHLIWWRLKLR